MAKKKPLKAIVWTEEQIEELAAVTQADIEQAAQFWRDNAPRPLQSLLDARPPTDNIEA